MDREDEEMGRRINLAFEKILYMLQEDIQQEDMQQEGIRKWVEETEQGTYIIRKKGSMAVRILLGDGGFAVPLMKGMYVKDAHYVRGSPLSYYEGSPLTSEQEDEILDIFEEIRHDDYKRDR